MKNYWIGKTKLPLFDQRYHMVAKLSKCEEGTQSLHSWKRGCKSKSQMRG